MIKPKYFNIWETTADEKSSVFINDPLRIYESIEELKEDTIQYGTSPNQWIDTIIQLTRQQEVDWYLGNFTHNVLSIAINNKIPPWHEFIIVKRIGISKFLKEIK